MNLEGKTVLITGAAGGIGRALVVELLAADVGCVVACDLAADGLATVAELDERVVARPLDVTDEAAVRALAAEQDAVDVVINCHGVTIQKSYLAADSLDDHRREMDINYWGQVAMCRAFAPVLARNRGGALVNFLSPLAYMTVGYCASLLRDQGGLPGAHRCHARATRRPEHPRDGSLSRSHRHPDDGQRGDAEEFARGTRPSGDDGPACADGRGLGGSWRGRGMTAAA